MLECSVGQLPHIMNTLEPQWGNSPSYEYGGAIAPLHHLSSIQWGSYPISIHPFFRWGNYPTEPERLRSSPTGATPEFTDSVLYSTELGGY